MTQSSQTLLLDIFEQRSTSYVQQSQHCYETFSEDSVHELRVAIRRLLALVELLRVVKPQLGLKKLRHACKDHLDKFDQLRDTQVMLTNVSRSMTEYPQQEVFHSYLLHREKQLLQSTQEELKAFDVGANLRQLKKVRTALKGADDKADLECRLFAAVDAAYGEVLQRHRCIDPKQAATIHRVRVSFKYFRYMAEILQQILSVYPAGYSKRMRHYQTIMGDIQDADVMLSTLVVFARSTTWYDEEPIRQFYNARHADLITHYLKQRDMLFELWRETPGSPFPWEDVLAASAD